MIEIKLLKEGYENNEKLYEAFLQDKIKNNDEFLSEEKVILEEAPRFPIYMGRVNQQERNEDFLEAFEVISEYYLKTDREIHMNQRFWHSLLCQNHREYVLENYPQIITGGFSEFNNIVIKKFNWENYIYRCIIGSQYVTDNIKDKNEQKRYFKLISENLDLYNYIIKDSIFRNDIFLIKILHIIDKYDIGNILKSRITDKGILRKYNLGKDERYGRRVVFEFNKSYPIVMVPMLDDKELEEKFFEYLNLYYDVSKIKIWNDCNRSKDNNENANSNFIFT